jgi:biotin-dependent carboxylase-like uncharacterized protein
VREIEVLEPGLLTTVQDLGRPGHAHLGVPRSGAVDPGSLSLANRLVGNAEGAAGLETTATGCRVRVGRATAIAVAGAICEVRIDDRAAAWGAAVPVPAGSTVTLGAASSGLRSYLAVAGGIAVEPELGSRATDVLSGLGPAALRVGDRLPFGPAAGPPSDAEAVPARRKDVVEVVLGPRADWFTPAALDVLDGAAYTVLAESNRIGIRLAGPVLERATPGAELPSEPMVLGAVQVPPSGRPVIFLHDHPTTGGYPVVAVVRAAGLAVCAQARPGEVLRFRVR